MATEAKYKIQPAPGRIAIQTSKVEDEVLSWGFILPSRPNEKSNVGRVIANCAEYEQDGESFDPLYAVGDVVIFGRFTGTEITVGRDTVLVIRETDILCRLVETSNSAGLPLKAVKISPTHAAED